MAPLTAALRRDEGDGRGSRPALLSVIIVTYRSDALIDACLSSIAEHNGLGSGLEVIVVDNSPADDPMFDRVGERYPWVRRIKNPRNGGYGQGNNLGARAASAPYLLVLNPDTVLVEEIFGFAVRKFEEDPDLSLFGIRLLDGKRNPTLSFGYRKEHQHSLSSFFIKPLNRLDLFDPDRMVTSGACMFLRKSVFLEAGGFDEEIFLYGEESYIAHALKKLDKSNKISFFPERSIVHLEKNAPPTESTKRLILQSQIHFLRKFGLSVEKNKRRLQTYNLLKLAAHCFAFRWARVRGDLEDLRLVRRLHSSRAGTKGA